MEDKYISKQQGLHRLTIDKREKLRFPVFLMLTALMIRNNFGNGSRVARHARRGSAYQSPEFRTGRIDY